MTVQPCRKRNRLAPFDLLEGGLGKGGSLEIEEVSIRPAKRVAAKEGF
jgi:hypothetical protein